jgi:V/A-type H+-transporting ATPase subunit A
MTYHEQFWKSELVDFIILQQDAFDPVDSVTPMDRQEYMLKLVLDICDRSFEFEDFEQCRKFFNEMINLLKQMNYSEFKSENFNKYQEQLNNLINNGK